MALTVLAPSPAVVEYEPLEELGWVWPAYISNGAMGTLLRMLEEGEPVGRRRILEGTLPMLYSPDHLARMVAARYPEVPCVRDYLRPIGQAVESAMLRNYHGAVSTLLPAIEGIIRCIANMHQRDVGRRWQKAVREIRLMAAQEREHGYDAANERAVMLEGFARFYESLHAQHEFFDGEGELNRHGIEHGIFRDYGSQANFCILMSMVDHLCFAMSIRTNGISALAPDHTEGSRRLLAHYAVLGLAALGRPATSDHVAAE